MRTLRKLEYGKGNIDVVDVDKPAIVDVLVSGKGVKVLFIPKG